MKPRFPAPARKHTGSKTARMIVLDKVSFRYHGKSETSFSLKEVSFSCSKGPITGIIGRNGSGKSTVARLIAGLICPDSGAIEVDGFAPFNHTGNCRFLAGIIFQNPDNQIVGTTVAEDIAFGLENLAVSNAEMHSRIRDVAGRFGLESLLSAPVNNLSGGQKQLLCIAAVLAMEPSWLIFDEPTSHLDPWSRIIFWQQLKSFARDHGIGVIVVSQLPEDLAQFDQILAFDQGQLAFQGSREELKSSCDSLPWFTRPESWVFEKLSGAKP